MSNSYSKTAKSYANALLKSNKNAASKEKILAQLNAIVSVIDGGVIKEFFGNYWTSTKEKLSLWNEVTKDLSIEKELAALIELMISNNRLGILSQVKRYLEQCLNKEKNLLEINLKTAQEINQKTKDSLTKDCERAFNSAVLMEFEVDKSILGGFMAYSDSHFLDLSIRRKFYALKQAFNLV